MTEDELLGLAAEIRDETEPQANTAERVGNALFSLVRTLFDRTTYGSTVPTGSALGGLAVGTSLAGKSHTELWEAAAAAAYKAATLSLQAAIAYFEKGTTAGVQLTGSITPNSDTITARRIKRNGATLNSPTTNSVSYTDNGVTAEASYTLEADAAAGTRTSAAVVVKPLAPSFYGAVATTTPTEATVRGLTKQLWPQAARTITINCAGTYPAFSEPQSNGIRTVIKDKNGFTITGDVVRTALVVQLADHTAEVPSTELHWLYVHKNPQTDPSFVFAL